MLVTAEMKGEFSSGDRTRGELYFRTGHVEDVDIGDREILAVVSGSRRNSYEVAIDRSLLSKGVLSAECSCPRFEDGYSCKHLWAVLLELEQMGLPMSAGTTRGEPQRAPQEQQAWQKHLQTVTRETQSLAGTVSADRFWARVKQAD